MLCSENGDPHIKVIIARDMQDNRFDTGSALQKLSQLIDIFELTTSNRAYTTRTRQNGLLDLPAPGSLLLCKMALLDNL